MTGFKRLPTRLAISAIRLTYALATLLRPVQSTKITFASYRSDQLKDNLGFLYEEWEKRGLPGKTVFLLKRYRSGGLGKLDYFWHMLKASWHLATSRFFIIDDYYFPVYVIKPRKGTDIIQLWHAAGAFKKFGHSTKGKSFGPSDAYLKQVKVHANYSRVMVSGKEVIPYYAEAFDMPVEHILPIGLPRADYFFQQDLISNLHQSFYKEYPELESKQLILYAPTFRGKSHEQVAFECPFNLSQMKEELSDQYVLLIHLHPYMKKGIKLPQKSEGFAYEIDGHYNIQELLSLADVLITDYSSVIFDYSLRAKPMAFFAHDLENYELERGFYYDYASLIPGPLFKETQDLIDWLKEGHMDVSQIEAFRKRFFDHADGKVSQRIVDYLERMR